LDLDNIPSTLTNNKTESLIELSFDERLKIEFKKLELDEIWIKVENKYPSLSKKVLLLLIPLKTTYLYEIGYFFEFRS